MLHLHQAAVGAPARAIPSGLGGTSGITTYTGAGTSSLTIDDDHVRWGLRSRRGATLDIVAERRRGGLLHAPVRTQMHRRVEETLDARVRVRFAGPAGRVLFDDEGHCAGLEVHGDLERLLAAR